MLPRSLNREFAFTINDVARMLRTYADYRGAQFGVTRAQWAVLVRLDRFEGLKQSELAEMLDLQPITLTRLLDRLCDSGLIERRSDPNDRRAKRLFLTAAARPMLEQLGALGEDMMTTALAGVSRETVEQIVAQLAVVKENLRQAIQQRPAARRSGRAALWLNPSSNLRRACSRQNRARRRHSPMRCASACASFSWSSCRSSPWSPDWCST